MGSEYVHAVLNLMVVILLMFSLFLVSKKYKLTKKKSNKQINIINSASIGTKEKILLIKVNGVMLLLGATPNHIETLYVFNEMEATKSESKDQAIQNASFSEQLSSVIN